MKNKKPQWSLRPPQPWEVFVKNFNMTRDDLANIGTLVMGHAAAMQHGAIQAWRCWCDEDGALVEVMHRDGSLHTTEAETIVEALTRSVLYVTELESTLS